MARAKRNGCTHLLFENALQNLVVVHKLIVVARIPLHFAHGDTAREDSIANLASDSTCEYNSRAERPQQDAITEKARDVRVLNRQSDRGCRASPYLMRCPRSWPHSARMCR